MPHQTEKQRKPFDTQGLLALEPQAFGMLFDVFTLGEAYEMAAGGKAAVVQIRGPIESRSGGFFDSYQAIRGRVAEALASEAECVILKIASPGGDVFGCFDTSRALRAMARAAGKHLYAFTEANACSSAYALASAADEISASDSSVLGSIGVISTAVDATAQARAQGLKFAIVTSGARKSDGNPMVELTDEAREAMQRSVDAMAAVFFGLVKEHRGIDAVALEAATFVGEAALAQGLCDRIESYDALLARVAKGEAGDTLSETAHSAPETMASSQAAAKAEDKKDEKDGDARKALAAAAASGDKRAARALKAYDESDDEKAADDKDPPKDDDKAKSKSTFEKDDDKAEDDKEKEKAIAAAASAPSPSAATDTRIAALEASAKRAILASRPDLSEDFVKACAGLTVEALERVVAAAPRAKPAATPAALLGAPAVPPLAGASGDDVDRSDKATTDALDMAFGTAEIARENVTKGVVQSFGVKRVKA